MFILCFFEKIIFIKTWGDSTNDSPQSKMLIYNEIVLKISKIFIRSERFIEIFLSIFKATFINNKSNSAPNEDNP